MWDPLQSKHCHPKINQQVLAPLQDKPVRVPPTGRPQSSPEKGQAGARLGWPRAGKSIAALPRRGAGLGQGFAAGEKGSLVQSPEAGEPQSRLCSRGEDDGCRVCSLALPWPG